MSDLEKMKNWLLTCPYLGADTLHTEHTDAAPVSSGLYPLGLEIVKETGDVLGNRTQHCRYRFLLRQVVPEKGVDADRLMRLQRWTQECAEKPAFGDEPEQVHIRAENGRLTKASQTGTAMYTVEITADFIKILKEKE